MVMSMIEARVEVLEALDATNCAELGACGYEAEPRDVDESGNIIMVSFFKVRQLFLVTLSSYAPR